MKTLSELKHEAVKENNAVKWNVINYYEQSGDVIKLFNIIGDQWNKIKKYEEDKCY